MSGANLSVLATVSALRTGLFRQPIDDFTSLFFVPILEICQRLLQKIDGIFR